MDPLSVIASIVRTVGIEIQIFQILRKEIDAIKTADERLEQTVIEIRATQQAWPTYRNLYYRTTKLLLMLVFSKMKGASKSLISSGGHISLWTIFLPKVLLLQLITKPRSKRRDNREEREGTKRLTFMIRGKYPQQRTDLQPAAHARHYSFSKHRQWRERKWWPDPTFY